MTENDTPKPGVTSTNPADTAKPGNVFRASNGATWILTADADAAPWICVRGSRTRWRDDDGAREAGLVRMVPAYSPAGYDAALVDKLQADALTAFQSAQAFAEWLIAEARHERGWVLPAPDASDPVQLRRAAKIANAVALAEDRGDDPFDSSYDALLETASHLFDRADRLDTDTKDRADRELAGRVIAERFPTDEVPAIAEFVLAGIRAGRDAAKAVQP